MAFGKELKRLREQEGISVAKLAERIGVDSGRMRKWEQKDFDPRDEDRAAIEKFFGMKLAEIEKLESISEFLIVPSSPTGSEDRRYKTKYDELLKAARAYFTSRDALEKLLEFPNDSEEATNGHKDSQS